jgi:hypothetical protein
MAGALALGPGEARRLLHALQRRAVLRCCLRSWRYATHSARAALAAEQGGAG